MRDPKKVAQGKADRALCPIPVAETLQLRVRQVAAAMRAAGVTEQVTVRQARAWKSLAEEPPAWMLTLMAQSTAKAARRQARNQRRNIEDEHRILLQAADVEQRLLSSRAIRGHDREFIASDYAYRAMKDLVRADGDVSYLNDLDLAALRWAGVLPADRSTWFLRAGGDVR
jgi:hypothetical protein